MTSDKKSRANRENSKNSSGPTSAEGKNRSRLNAFKTGLFAQGLVLAAAGERQVDFDALLLALRGQFEPDDFLSLHLLEDLASIIWRQRRIRRFESAEIQKQCSSRAARSSLEKIAEVNAQKERFIQDSWKLRTTAPRSEDGSNLNLSIEKTRGQLEKTSLGLQFLIQQIDAFQKTLERNGYLSADELQWLVSVCGVGDDHTISFMYFNSIAKAKVEELRKDEGADRTSSEQNKRMLSEVLKSKKDCMGLLKQIVESLESAEEKDSLKSLVMLSPESCERIHRAEAPLRRDFYKTLDVLLKVIYGVG